MARQLLQSSSALHNHSEILYIFDPTKKIKCYVQSPDIDLTVPPVVQKLRRLPLAFTNKVRLEMDRLIKKQILEPIESSLWVCNMIIAPKANGDVRVCADLSDASRAVIPDRYPLLNFEELSNFFAGSRFFS